MQEDTLRLCQQFIKNRDILKTTYFSIGSPLAATAAIIHLLNNHEIDEKRLRQCRQSIKKESKVFSGFRGSLSYVIASVVATKDDYESEIKNLVKAQHMIHQAFNTSGFADLTALILYENFEVNDFNDSINTLSDLYKQSKKEHPIFMNRDKLPLMLLAQLHAVEPLEDYPKDIFECYNTLQLLCFSKGSAHLLSPLVARDKSRIKEESQKMASIYKALRSSDNSLGTSAEVLMLSLFSFLDSVEIQTVNEITEVSKWLLSQSGFGLFSSITKKYRIALAIAIVFTGKLHGEASKRKTISALLIYIVIVLERNRNQDTIGAQINIHSNDF